MEITIFSIITSILLFSLSVLAFRILIINTKLIKKVSITTMFFIISLIILRVIVNMEFSNNFILNDSILLPKVFRILQDGFTINGYFLSFFKTLIIVWILGIIYLLIKNLIQHFLFLNSLSTQKKMENEKYNQILKNILTDKKINNHNIRVFICESINFPMIIGLKKPSIYLPNMIFNEKEIYHLLSHEVNHYLGKDILKKVGVLVIKIVFWWNPLSNVFFDDFNHLLELQCDHRSTKDYNYSEKKDYLNNILNVLEHLNSKNNIQPTNVIPMLVSKNSKKAIRQRFELILDKQHENKYKKLFYNTLICIISIIVFLSSYSFVIQPLSSPNCGEYMYKEEFMEFNSEDELEQYINNVIVK